ncbi:ATP-dependent DNA helicase sgs1 [Puccinia graminis f. sp. tritici]|uniref:ATP-dependent DNA helicase sgs1 n=1 Tax=Puccinia graminis f. sp. tritici TaxID=56615 RepID=A0A5B0RTX8_PUCGR|nr:ATP-dependent DNA helicase sgs1 [Puccinia graminis f. sp. tritici]
MQIEAPSASMKRKANDVEDKPNKLAKVSDCDYIDWLEMGASNPDIRADADIRSRFQRKHTSASASGYPPALADQLVGRNPSRRAGLKTSSLGAVSPSELACGRSPGGTPPGELACRRSPGGVPPDELV